MPAVREERNEVRSSGVTGFDREIDICVCGQSCGQLFKPPQKSKCEKHWRGSFPDSAGSGFCLTGRPRVATLE